MFELLRHMLLPYNLPFTLLLGFVTMYWILSAVGVLGVELLDGLFDFGSGDSAGGDGGDPPFGGAFQSAFRFLNANDVPIAVIFSILSIFLWLGNVLLNYYFNPDHTWARAGLLFLPNLALSALLTRFATLPLVGLMGKMKAQALTHIQMKGKVGTVRTAEVSERFGQVELDGEGTLLIAARVENGNAPLTRNTRVTVLSEPDENGVHVVAAIPSASPTLSDQQPS